MISMSSARLIDLVGQTSHGSFTSGRKLISIVFTPCPSRPGQQRDTLVSGLQDMRFTKVLNGESISTASTTTSSPSEEQRLQAPIAAPRPWSTQGPGRNGHMPEVT
jgi:hypothetical protein